MTENKAGIKKFSVSSLLFHPMCGVFIGVFTIVLFSCWALFDNYMTTVQFPIFIESIEAVNNVFQQLVQKMTSG